MTNPNSGQPPPFDRRLWLLLTSRTSLLTGTALLIVLAGGMVWAWIWIHRQLAPLVEHNLAQLLGRPVNVGKLERVSFTSLRFGPSTVPATPTDPDRATAKAVDVQFSPLQLLLRRTLQLNVTLVQPDAYIEQSKDGRWLSTTLHTQENNGWLKTDLQSIRIRQGHLVLQPAPKPSVPNAVVGLNQLNGAVRFLDQNQRFDYDASGQLASGGNVNLTGETQLKADATNVMLRAQNVPAIDISRLVALPIGLQAGRVNGNLTAQFRSRQAPQLTGTANLNKVAVQIPQLPQQFVNTNGQLQFQGNTIAFDHVRTQFGQVLAQVNGTVNTQTGFNLVAQVPAVSAKNLLSTLKVNAPVPISGTLRAQVQVQGTLQQPVVSGAVNTIRTAQIDRVPFRAISSRFQLTTAGKPPQIAFSDIRAVPQAGGQITGRGQIRLGSTPDVALAFRADDVPGDTIAQLYGVSPNITIGAVSAIAQVVGVTNNLQTVVQFRAPNATYPGAGTIRIAANRGLILLQNAVFDVAGGTVQASGQYTRGQFQAVVDANRVGLSQFSQALRGRLSGRVQLAGRSFQLAGIQAAGRLKFSEGLAIVRAPLTAQVRWTGQQLQIDQATAPGLLASGTVAVRTTGSQAPAIDNLNLAVQARGYDLQDLGLNLPGNISLLGRADFAGRVTGSLAALNASGGLQLHNLLVNGVAFDPLMVGSLDFQLGRRTSLQLAGQQIRGTQDQIALTLGPNNRPTSFLIKRDEAIATGTPQGENLLINVQRFPVALLQNFVPAVARSVGTLAGELSGTIALNLNRLAAAGTVAIANPRVGRLTGDSFRADFRYANGVATLSNGELTQGNSRIALGGSFQTTGARPIDLRINFDQANVQNLLQTLSAFNLGDLGTGLKPPDLARASALQTFPINVSEAAVITQIRRLAEIQALLAQKQAQASSPSLPPLSALQGQLNGSIAISGSLQKGINASFNLRGANWTWAQYQIDRVIAEGNYANGTLTVLPLQVGINGGLLAFSGQVGTGKLAGQLQATQLPLELVQPFLTRFPVNVAGPLDATVTLAGNLANPQATGVLNIRNGRLNTQTIQQGQLTFRYTNARLNFDSNLLLTGTQPLRVTGGVPVALPFASVQPTSDQIQVRALVADDGLALLNAFTNQVNWVNGRGQLNVAVTGTLKQPLIEGSLAVQNATLKAQALSQPLTNVTGTAQFNRDRVLVQNLQAQYNKGPVVAQGVLPILPTADAVREASTNPLTVSSQNLAVNLNGLYQGDVGGNVIITGSAFAPVIGGQVQLTNGQVAIGQGSAGTSDTTATAAANGSNGTTESSEAPAIAAAGTGATAPSPIGFNNLQLILGKGVRVTSPPLLSFTAEGTITLNGAIGDFRPNGLIRLTGGQVNLFTTQFRLERGYPQTARFVPSQGLDPILDVRLIALVPEATGGRQPTSPISSEIVDDPIRDNTIATFGTLRTITVIARATGPASELSQNLQLSSSPSRSESEIVALIGGTFVNNLGQSNSALGLASFAGSTVFNSLQGTITELGQTIGLSELRIFPSIVQEPNSNASVLGLAAEAGIDVAKNITFSLSKVFATTDPLRYNLLYRVNDEILVRGSTDFSGDTRASVEYETRF